PRWRLRSCCSDLHCCCADGLLEPRDVRWVTVDCCGSCVCLLGLDRDREGGSRAPCVSGIRRRWGVCTYQVCGACSRASSECCGAACCSNSVCPLRQRAGRCCAE